MFVIYEVCKTALVTQLSLLVCVKGKSFSLRRCNKHVKYAEEYGWVIHIHT